MERGKSNPFIRFFESRKSKKKIPIYPITKEKIQKALFELKDNSSLNNLEQLELSFYLKEYSNERKKLYFRKHDF